MLREERREPHPLKLSEPIGRTMTHILGEHAKLVIHTARHCHPNTHTPQQADALIEALLHCIDLAGGATAATKLDGTGTPDKLPTSNRTRSNQTAAPPMNPVHRRNGGNHSTPPTSDLDSGYWRHEYHRVTTHFDRCEAIRRAAPSSNASSNATPTPPKATSPTNTSTS
jgi:hypothetical protein